MKAINKRVIVYVIMYLVLCAISLFFIRFYTKDEYTYYDEWNIFVALYYFIALPIAAAIPLIIVTKYLK